MLVIRLYVLSSFVLKTSSYSQYFHVWKYFVSKFWIEYTGHAQALACRLTLPTAETLSGKNERAFLVCGFLMKSLKKKYPENMKKIWEPFGSYLLNSTANPAHFYPNWAGLAVLFSRQLLNGSQDFFFGFNI